MYVDDVIIGVNNENQAYEFYKDSKSLMKCGGFNLRKYVTNSATLQDLIDNDKASQKNAKKAAVVLQKKTYTKSIVGNTTVIGSSEHKVWEYAGM